MYLHLEVQRQRPNIVTNVVVEQVRRCAALKLEDAVVLRWDAAVMWKDAAVVWKDAAVSAADAAVTRRPLYAWFIWVPQCTRHICMRDVSTVIESFDHIRTVLEAQGPFQGILGFSQGAAFAAMILAFMENPDLDQNLLRNVKHPAFEFAAMVSGFVAPTQEFPLPPRIRTPSLHIMGLNDIMVAPEISTKLADRFETAQVEIHQGGHFIPRTRAWRSFLCEYLRSRASASGAVPDHIRPPTSPGYRKKLFGYYSARM
ncbi:serine hydrolase-domain-containing protein [Mycena galericulata]|nr:serine hydrolase-domain-containing protein [Mycena galericulata]